MLIDANSQWASEAAGAKLSVTTNPNMRVFATAWSPPTKYKQNGVTTGNNQGNTNFNPAGNSNVFVSSAANYTGYANYLVGFINAMKTTYGVNLYAVSPQNEPDYDVTYDSCLWTPQQFHDLIGTYLGPAIQTAGLSTKIMMPESFADNQTGSNTTMNDTAVAPYVSVIGMHLYGGGPTALPASYATNAGHPVSQWVTEMSDFANNDPSMTNGMVYAKQIHNCIVDRNFNGYCFWWLINMNTDNEGLCDNNSNPTKKLYVMGNFSKFIRPGFVRIAATEAPATNVQVSAYYSTSTAKAVIVAINSGTAAVNQSFTLGGTLNATNAYPWITDSTRNLVQQTVVAVSGGGFTYSLPANSVVSFVCPIGGGSSSPTFTVTPSRTPSPTATRTTTPTSSYSGSPTPSPTATATAEPSATRTATPTSSYSGSPTPSPTATATAEPSATRTVTATFSSTATSSASPTVPVSVTVSDTVTETSTRTQGPTASSTATASATLSASVSPSTSSTPSATVSFTATLTASATPTPTASPAFSGTASSTATLTASATPTPTVSEESSAISTETVTLTSSPSSTATSTSLATASPTFSPTTTPTAAVDPTGTVSAETIPAPGGLKVDRVVPVPNPQPGGVLTLSVHIIGRADSLKVRLYSVALVQVVDLKSAGGSGWVQAIIPLPSLPTGLYYGRVTASQGGRSTDSPIFKVVFLR
jgi:glucuronoarabinoxylan endo-1,4-beta-xylanase